MVLQPGKDEQKHSSIVSLVQAMGKYSSCCSALAVKQQIRAKCLDRTSKKKKKRRKLYFSFSLSKHSHTLCEYGTHSLGCVLSGNAFYKERRLPAVVNSIIKMKWNKEIKDMGIWVWVLLVWLFVVLWVLVGWFDCFLFCKDEDVLSVTLLLWTLCPS